MPPAAIPAQEKDLQSKVITWSRFAFIAGVLLMHTYTVAPAATDGWFAPIFIFFSKITSHSSVPAFFFISGYLFFYSRNPLPHIDFSLKTWTEKLKRRSRTLLVPYIFWISAWLLGYFFLYKTPLASILHLGTDALAQYTPEYILSAYWCFHGNADYQTFPLVGQFWFIRDLMVIILLSPIVWFLLKKIPLPFLLLSGIFWLFDGHFPWLGLTSSNIPLVGPNGLSHTVVFFFSLGAYFAITKKLFTVSFWKIRHILFIAYPLLVCAMLYLILDGGLKQNTPGWTYEAFWFHRLTVFVGVFFFILLIYYLIKTNRTKPNAFLASASFFVFAIHQEWLRIPAKKLFIDIPAPKSDLALLLCYAGHFAFYIFCSLAIYYLLNRLFPRFTTVIVGNR
jgi:fucose 4-O-acetylase-like acetyltransferase